LVLWEKGVRLEGKKKRPKRNPKPWGIRDDSSKRGATKKGAKTRNVKERQRRP